jgi:hypothetical protein
VPESENPKTNVCDECGSEYFRAASHMSQLCNECAHWLYGYPRCAHEFVQGRCSRCGWDGSVSAYLRGLQARPGEQEV